MAVNSFHRNCGNGGTDAYGRDNDLKMIFSDGEALESPEVKISYNTRRKQDNSSITINLRLQGAKTDDYVTAENISTIQSLAYEWLRERNMLFYNVNGAILILKSIKTTPIAGTDIWEAECEFGPSDTHDASLVKTNFTFSTTAKTTKIVRSFGTESVDLTGGPGFDCGGQIGWNGEGWEGCDIYTPTLSFTRDIWVMEDDLSWNEIRGYSDYTGYINSDVFYGFEPGEVLFKGVTNSQRVSTQLNDSLTIRYWALTLAFECMYNTWMDFEGYSLYKRGWDYLWYLYFKTVIDYNGDKTVCKWPYQMNVEQVYPEAPFCELFEFGWNNGAVDEDAGRIITTS